MAIAILLSCSSAPLIAAPGDPVGGAFLANTGKVYSQYSPVVALDADGDFVIVWNSFGQDGSSWGVYAQRYQADGLAVGGEFLVNTETTGSQLSPSVALDADGDFVIVWHGYGQDGSSWDVYAQRYQADGLAVGGGFLVNTETTGRQLSPNVALDADGDFVIAWTSSSDYSPAGIQAQRYQADGTEVGGEFLVNTGKHHQSNPVVAMDADGDFVITWMSYLQDGIARAVYAQRYQADGSAVGGEVLVNTGMDGFLDNPSVALDADGDFVITWQSYGQDGSSWGVYARRYQADGLEVGGEFLVNTQTADAQFDPSVAMDADGDFVITWTNSGQDGIARGVYAQRYQSDGAAVGHEFLVNAMTANFQTSPSIALDADGDFVIAWTSDTPQNGNARGIYAQRYEGAGSSSVDLNLVLKDDTDLVKKGNNFVYTIITTNNGTGIALDVNLSEPLLADLIYVSDDSASAGWSCVQASATLNCNRAFLNTAQVSTINVTVTANTVGELSHTVTATAAQIDADSSDNSDTETTMVEGSDGGALSWFSLLLFVPLWLRRRLG